MKISDLPSLRLERFKQLEVRVKDTKIHSVLINNKYNSVFIFVKISSLTAVAPSPVVQPYINYVMMGMIKDDDSHKHVQQLRQKHFKIDQSILHNINKMQDHELARFYAKKKQCLDEKRSIEVGDYVFELKESPKPLEAIADGPYLVVKKDAGKVVLRTGTTKWDPVAKEYERRADLLIPCLTRKQALAKAHAKPITPANREATVVSFLH